MPKPLHTASGDFLAFVEDLKRKDTKELQIGERTFFVRGPSLFTDAEMATLASDKATVFDKARLMIDDYDAFTKAGGTAMALSAWYDAQFNQADEGEGEASSSS